MKGLLRKDLYMVRSYCLKLLLIMLLFLGAFIIGNEEVAFYLVFPCMFAGLIPMTILAYDEREKWSVCASALPVGKAQIVTVKYLLIPILLTPAVLVSLLALLIKDPATIALRLNALSASVAIGMLAPAIILPFCFLLGVEKGRLAYYGVLGVLFAGGSYFAARGGALPLPDKSSFLNSPAALPLLALAVLLISWRVTVALYQKREW